jgi:lipopolysaccharide transport system permease protein
VLISFWRYRELIVQMAKREVIGRYRGSIMGLLWSFFNPLLLLLIYTFVFGFIFKTRWGINTDNKTEFAILLFAGLIIYNLLAECLNRAPNLILSNTNYVKKVVFPLEILPWVTLGSALFHMLISIVILLLFFIIINHAIPWTAFYFPLVLLPFIFFIMGAMWFLAALGVFIRDISQIMGIITTGLLFMSPIFYPVTMLPAAYQHYLYLNPLTFIVEQTRAVLLLGNSPQWLAWGGYFIGGFLFASLGLWWFQKARKGFADVL